MTFTFDGTKISSIEQKSPINTLSCSLPRAGSARRALGR
jgi:hypothetical protein